MALGGGNFPYTFGFIDQLVRINFPQDKEIFVTFNGPGSIFSSKNGKSWTKFDTLLVEQPIVTTISSNYGKVDTATKTNLGVFLVLAFSVADVPITNPTTFYIFSSNDGVAWRTHALSEVLNATGNAWPTSLRYDKETKTFWVLTGAGKSHGDPTEFVIYSSTDGENWVVSGSSEDDIPEAASIYTPKRKNPKTGTQVTAELSTLPIVDRTTKDGAVTQVSCGTRSIADTAFADTSAGPVFVSSGGAPIQFPDTNGPQMCYSTDDGKTFTVGYDENSFSFFDPHGCSMLISGQPSKSST